jgi:hypothetical protein
MSGIRRLGVLIGFTSAAVDGHHLTCLSRPALGLTGCGRPATTSRSAVPAC